MAPYFRSDGGKSAYSNLKLSPGAQAIVDDTVLNARTIGFIMAKVAEESLGSSGIEHSHFSQVQSAPLSPKWLADPRKADSGGKRFFQSGRVYKAITTAPAGQVRAWGSSADWNAIERETKLRYASMGIYVSANIGKEKAHVTIGFVGKMGLSKEHGQLRRQIFKERFGRAPRNARELSQRVSVASTDHRARAQFGARGTGSDYRKHALKGSLGFDSHGNKRKFDLARGDENLGYANIVQSGKFAGVRGKSGKLYNPKESARINHSPRDKAFKDVSKGRGEFGKGMELLPFKSSDEGRIIRVIERALSEICTQLNAA